MEINISILTVSVDHSCLLLCCLFLHKVGLGGEEVPKVEDQLEVDFQHVFPLCYKELNKAEPFQKSTRLSHSGNSVSMRVARQTHS